MKQLIKNYSYNTTAKTVTLTDFTTLALERLQLITNTTTNAIIYNFADSSVASATVSGNVITLSVAPGSNSDKLMIIYDSTNADPVYDSYRESASLTAGSLNADLVPSTDVSAFKSFSLQVAGTFSGTLTFQASNDNVNFVSIGVQITTQSLASSLVTTASTAGIYAGPLNFRYLRVRMTSYASGTATGTLELFSKPSQYAMTAPTSIQTLRTISRQTLQASAVQTASNNSAANTAAASYSEAIVTLNVTAASGTTPSLAVVIQVSDDGGTTWFPLPGGTFTPATGITTQALQINTFGDTIRASSTITGTSPSFTYAVKAVYK